MDFCGGAETIEVVSDPSRIAGGTCGSSLWACGPALVDWLSSDAAEASRAAALWRGKRVLELGAGLGFAGLALAKLGARHVTLTDMTSQLPIIRRNAIANGSPDSVDVRALHWGPGQTHESGAYDLVTPSHISTTATRVTHDLVVPAPAHPQRAPPIPSLASAQILGCDLIYDADAVPNLAHTITELLSANPSATALIAAPDRCEFAHTRRGDPEPLPDYHLLFDVLTSTPAPRGPFYVEQLASLPPEVTGTASSLVDIFAVSKTRPDDYEWF